MSLVPTYVQMADTCWYKNPVIYHDDWFLCFDDDDPPELVFKIESLKQRIIVKEFAEKILEKNKINADVTRVSDSCQRPYPPEWNSFHQSISVFLKINSPIDLKYLRFVHDGKFQKKEHIPGEYVAYGFD